MKAIMEFSAIVFAANALFIFVVGVVNILFEWDIAVEGVALPYHVGELALWSLGLLVVGGLCWLLGNLKRIFNKMGKSPLRSVAIAATLTAFLVVGGNYGLTFAMGGPLQRAVEMGNTQQVEQLLAEQSYSPAELEKPLYFALKQSNEEIANALVASGADVNATSQGEFATPLLLSSVLHFEPEAIAFLLTHGADIDATDNKGRTAMDIAQTYRAEADQAAVITMLSEAETAKQP